MAVYISKAQSGAGAFWASSGQADYITPADMGYAINIDSVDYSECKGSPFWNNNWNPAILVLNNGKAVRLNSVRLDLYTNQLRYKLGQGPELVAKAGTVEKIIFLNSADTAKVFGAFESFNDVGRMQNKTYAPFCQVLNFGKVQLVKSYMITMDKKVDPIEGKTITIFQSQVNYYLLRDKIFSPLKRLNKENVLSFVITNADANNWLETQKNKLKNETEIISFLDYYNSRQ